MLEQEQRKDTLYVFATLGARTKRGGYYADCTAERITGGLALKMNRRYGQFAYVVSTLDNGDTITDSPERKGGAHPGTYEPVTETGMHRESVPA